MGQGFQRILKMYGKIEASDSKGNKVVHVWDYANDKPIIEGEMTKEQISASEKAKFEIIKKQGL